jgi:hypothetical protein
MHKSIFLIFIIILSLSASSQDYPFLSRRGLDSLLKSSKDPEMGKQLEALNALAHYYAPINFDSSIMFASQSMRHATQYGFLEQIGIARYNIGNAYYYRLDFKNALLSYYAALRILEENNYINSAGRVYLQIGNINFFIKRTEKTLSSYHMALACFESTRDEKSAADVYEAMSLALDNLGYQPEDTSLYYGYKLLNYARKIHDHYREALALIIIGQIHINFNPNENKNLEAISYNDTAMQIAEKFKFEDLQAIICINMGAFYGQLLPGSDNKAGLLKSREYYQKAYQWALKVRSSYTMALTLNALALINIEEKKYDNARIRLDESEARLNYYFSNEWKHKNLVITDISFQKIMDFFLAQREQLSVIDLRYMLATAKGEYKKANEYLQMYYSAQDSMNAAQQGQQLEIIMAEEAEYRQAQKLMTMSKENELSRLRLNRSRIIWAAMGSIVVIASVLLLLFIQRKRLKAEKKSLIMEQRLLRSQMNPHFIFNSLASIQNFVINENSDQASIYLSKFSQLVRNILDNSVEEYVTLEKEISTVENYLELQKVRYAGKFDYSIRVDEKIDEEAMMIPPMLAQPFIENAIEHGIRHKEGNGHIQVCFRIKDELIRFEVEDDGVGREKAFEIESRQKSRHVSMATSITRDRLSTLNKKLKRKINLEIIDLKDDTGKGVGTRVEFGIPVKL